MKKPELRRHWFDNVLKAVALLGAAIVLVSLQQAPDLLNRVLIAFGVVFLGFALPRWVGWHERKKRAVQAKKDEKAKWGFHSRDREGPWLNYVDFPVVKKTPIADGKFFYSEWLIIHDGTIVVNPGYSTTSHCKVEYDFSVRRAYAWDGCSPKRWFYWVALFGTPDWGDKLEEVTTISQDTTAIKSKEVVWQRAHHASLVHDALYQYLNQIPIDKRDVDQLFHDMLIVSGFNHWVAKIYHSAVHRFGASDVGETEGSTHPNKNFELINPPACLVP